MNKKIKFNAISSLLRLYILVSVTMLIPLVASAGNDSQLNTLANITAEILNDGEECKASSSNLAAAKLCRELGKQWNCQYNSCYSIKYRTDLVKKAASCVQISDAGLLRNCKLQIGQDLAYATVSGDFCDTSTSTAKSCLAQNKSWNCNLQMCLSNQSNRFISSKISNCYKLDDSALVQKCLQDEKTNSYQSIVNSCVPPNNFKGNDCSTDPERAWNCYSGQCVGKLFNDGMIETSKTCFTKNKESETLACLDVIKELTTSHVLSGFACNKQTTDAINCREQGKVYNCEFNSCVTKEQNESVATDAIKCMIKEDRDNEQAICRNKIKESLINTIAKGSLCTATAESTSCAVAGKTWNCHVNMCFTKMQNDQFASKITTCKMKEDQLQIDQCLDGLADKAIGTTLFTCDTTGNVAAEACAKEEGRGWNCSANLCFSDADNTLFFNDLKSCMLKDEPERTSCANELDTISLAMNNSSNLETDHSIELEGIEDIKDKINQLLAMSSMTALCPSGMLTAVGSSRAKSALLDSEKSSQEKIDGLNKKFSELEAKIAAEGVSIEIQYQVFDFLIQSLEEAEDIALDFGEGYAKAQKAYNMATVMGAFELTAVLTPLPACAMINMPLASKGKKITADIIQASEKLANDFITQREIIIEIKTVFEKHFKNKGSGLDINPDDNLAENGNSEQTGGKSGENLGNGVNKLGGNGNQFDIGGNGSGLNLGGLDSGNHISCLSADQSVDQNCDCRKSGTCYSLAAALNNKNFLGIHDKILSNPLIASSISDIDKASKGEVAFGSSGRAALGQTNMKLKHLGSNLLKQIKSIRKKNNLPPLAMGNLNDLDKKLKQLSSKKDNQFANSDQLSAILGGGDFMKGAVGDSLELSKNKLKQKGENFYNLDRNENKSSNNGVAALDLSKIFGKGSLKRGNSKNYRGLSYISSKDKDRADPEISEQTQINDDLNFSIFNIISNRYNVIKLTELFD